MSNRLRTGRKSRARRAAWVDREEALIQPSLAGRSLAGRDLLQLQRSIGNRAVSRLVSARGRDARGPRPRCAGRQKAQQPADPLPAWAGATSDCARQPR